MMSGNSRPSISPSVGDLSKDDVFSLFNEVHRDLVQKSTVGWQNAVTSFELALNNLECKETQDFLDTCCNRIVSIMVDQHPSKIGHFEKSCVVRSLNGGVRIIIDQLKRRKYQYISTLALILNKKKLFYKDFRSSAAVGNYWNKVPGAPEVRTQCLTLFYDEQGFEVIAEILEIELSEEKQSQDLSWIDCDDARIILLALADHYTLVSDDLCQRISLAIMQYLSRMSSDQLKREPTDIIGGIVQHVKKLMEVWVVKPKPVFELWLQLTLTYIRSSSLPLRLFGFEQVVGLIQTAKHVRPFPSKFVVKDAGTRCVNGVYQRCPDHSLTARYMKEDDNGQVFTLFQCTMRSGSKWWFISEADKDQPGTDKDIDYYQHQSQEEEVIPPLHDWLHTGHGVPPAPELSPLEIDNMDENDLVERRLITWVLESKSLEDVFGDRIHREIVSRSSSLVKFMSESNSLTISHLDMIWASAIGKEEALADEVYALLSSVVPYLPDKLLVHLLKSVRLTLDENGLTEAVAFAERLSMSNIQVLFTKNASVTENILLLLWSIQKHPQIHPLTPSTDLVVFLNDALRSQYGETQRSIFLKECVETIKKSLQSDSEKAEDEHCVSRALELLKFLIDTYTNEQAVIVESLDNEHLLIKLLFKELEAFTKKSINRSSESYKSAISHRLNLIRYLHGKSYKLNMSIQQVESMWNILRTADERELCLVFLSQAGIRGNGLEPAFNLDICFHVFNELICKDTDFSSIGELGYNCFHTYFIGLNCHRKILFKSNTNAIRRTVSLDLLGIDALWSIVLDAPNNVSEIAMKELLSVYESLSEPSTGTASDFLNRIFERLKNIDIDDPTSWNLICKSLSLLEGFVSVHKSRMPTSHGLEGRRSRYKITIQGQRIGQGGGTGVQEKISPIKIDVHGKETLSSVRIRIQETLQHPSENTKLLLGGSSLTNDLKTLEELRIVEDSEIRALLFGHLVHKMTTRFQDETPAKSIHPGSLISQNKEFFEILFHILDFVSDTESRNKIFEFLQNIPTNKQLYELVSEIASKSNPKSVWEELLDPNHYHKSIYVMEIVDNLLFPSESSQDQFSEHWVKQFVDSMGFEMVLRFLMNDDSELKSGHPIALRIVKFCLFDSVIASGTRPNLKISDSKGANRELALKNVDYSMLMAKLRNLVISEHRSPSKNSARVILDALQTIETVIEQRQTSLQFLNPDIRDQIIPILTNDSSDKVRNQWVKTLQVICRSSMESKKVLMQALTEAVRYLDIHCFSTEEFFLLLEFLIKESTYSDEYRTLTCELIKRIHFEYTESNCEGDRLHDFIIGCLRTLQFILETFADICSEYSMKLLDVIYEDCLFATPSKGKNTWPLCANLEARKPALSLLVTAARTSIENMNTLIDRISRFLQISSKEVSSKWGYECNVESRSSGEHVGLKNQGCTCYMNSFLQQLYMEPTLRRGLIAAKLPARVAVPCPTMEEIQLCPDKLIGYRISVSCANGKCYDAIVEDYDSVSEKHLVRYDEGDEVNLQLIDGKYGSSVGPFSVIRMEPKGDEATLEILREVQKTFCYLQESEMRFCNPRALVEASKCLNLEFSVYQQNDASEFCDKLLDRLEFGLKKTPQGAKCLQYMLGGKLLSQKLPKGCGHRYEREEPFIRLELQIRGKESIQESLSAFVEGELMDGDNKVECELCGTKKSAIRRTCFGVLPNLLILHLKRFDLDYTTFETVKLNNRCSFPLNLNMKPYTKRGIEEEENEKMESNLPDDIGEVSSTEGAYEYNLKGVLVHSGVAQGGHYYSFIVDRKTGKWSKFDDEDVSPFDPSQIESECFGGMQTRTTNWHGVNNTMEMEVFSNALMLFYEKVEPTHIDATDNFLTATGPSEFEDEIWESNIKFMQLSYLMDPDFHEFLRSIVESGSNAMIEQTPNSAEWKSLDFRLLELGCNFVFNVLVHSREKTGMTSWISTLRSCLEGDIQGCRWLFGELVASKNLNWLERNIILCPDPIARQSVVQLLTHAFVAYDHQMYSCNLREEEDSRIISRLASLMNSFLKFCPSQGQYFEELFLLLRNFAEKSAMMRNELVLNDSIGRLVNFFLGGRSPKFLKEAFALEFDEQKMVTPDFQFLLEAICSLLGIERKIPASLLAENPSGYHRQPQLSDRAVDIFTSLFQEYSSDNLMGPDELRKYFRASGITSANAAAAGKQIGNMISRFGRPFDNPKLKLEGFLEYYADKSATTPKDVLNLLNSFGYGEDLRRRSSIEQDGSRFLESLPDISRMAIVHEQFFEAAFEEDAESVADMFCILSVGNQGMSNNFLKCCLRTLQTAEAGWKGQPEVDACLGALWKLLAVENNLQATLIETALSHPEYGILSQAKERAMIGHRYPNNYQAPQHVNRLIIGILDLYKIVAVRKWLDDCKDKWSWMYKWLCSASLQPSLGGRPASLSRNPVHLETLSQLGQIHGISSIPETISYLVEGAGTPDVNGVYKSTGEWDNCPTFTHQGNNRIFTLFRCALPSGARRWYISITPENGALGTSSDIDFYYVPVPASDEYPPVSGWRLWHKNSEVLHPPPTVQLDHSALDGAGEIDNEVDDEFDDSEDDVRVSNGRLQALHLDNQSDDRETSDFV